MEKAHPSRIYTVDFILSLEEKYRDRILRSETVDKFVAKYRTIISQDAINPIFSLTTQYSKFPNSKIKKFKKFDNSLYIKSKNAWVPYSNVDDNVKLLHTIKATLNKITDKNYNVLYEELLNKLKQYQDVGILDTISTEIINKAIYDINFQSIYIDICHKLWTNLEWQDNLFTVVVPEDEPNKFYWYVNDCRVVGSPTLNGPYKNESDLMAQVRPKVNLKNNFLNLLQDMFNKRREYVAECLKNENDDEMRFRFRRQIFGPIEIIGKLYRKKLIPQSIVHNLILELFYYKNPANTLPCEEEIETFQILWNIIDNGKNIPFKPVLINQYLKLLQEIQQNTKFSQSTRINFIITEIFCNYNNKYEDKITIAASPIPTTTVVKTTAVINVEHELLQYLKKHEVGVIVEQLMKGTGDKMDAIGDILYFVCEYQRNIDLFIKLWKTLEAKEYFKDVDVATCIKNLRDNLEDVELDCPGAKQAFDSFISQVAVHDLPE